MVNKQFTNLDETDLYNLQGGSIDWQKTAFLVLESAYYYFGFPYVRTNSQTVIEKATSIHSINNGNISFPKVQ